MPERGDEHAVGVLRVGHDARNLLRVAESAPRRPAGFPANIRGLLTEHSWPRVDAYCRDILAFAGVDFAEADALWPTRFMQDTELKWMTGEPPIDEL